VVNVHTGYSVAFLKLYIETYPIKKSNAENEKSTCLYGVRASREKSAALW